MQPTPFEGPGWRVMLPPGISTRLTPRPPPDGDIDSMGIARGYEGDVPVTVILTTRPRAGRRPADFLRLLSEDFDPQLETRSLPAPKGSERLLATGTRYVDEGVVLDAYEHVTVVLHSRADVFTTLAVRTPVEDPLPALVDAIIASFEVASAG